VICIVKVTLINSPSLLPSVCVVIVVKDCVYIAEVLSFRAVFQ